MVITGLENLLRSPEILDNRGRLGLLYNQASVDSCFIPTSDLIDLTFPDRLKALFGPQHGVHCTEQDNMKETPHDAHPRLGIPVFSLYGEARRPDENMLETVDTIIVDLQDVGTRVYTFATTVLYVMEACAKYKKSVVILDRPNPIGGEHVEGNVLNPAYSSFVGPHPLPMRHGMTIGELMSFYNTEYGVNCDLEVVPMSGWSRSQYFDETGLPWVLPSPNMPSIDTSVVYPGQVILEGTNLSEGRGTTKPFELFGAPWLNPEEILATIEKAALRGAILQQMTFRPTFNKWQGQVCHGFHLYVTDRKAFKPYRFSMALLSAVIKTCGAKFAWSDPPYEYVSDKLPIDVILGDKSVREQIQAGRSILDLEKEWAGSLHKFMKLRSKRLMY
jgi:uncharacterized protein YbbC (DUF1343 family)